jgi:hypothetical protein
MKIASVIAILLCTLPVSSFAENRIELFTDVNHSSCEISDQGGIKTLHVFLTGTNTATLAAFRARVPSCWTGATWLFDDTQYVSVGNSQQEISVAFGLCLAPPVHVAEINIMTSGAAPQCCEMHIEQPIDFALMFVDCGFAETPVNPGQHVTVNPTEQCPCMNPIRTESSTWGKVKSLYR